MQTEWHKSPKNEIKYKVDILKKKIWKNKIRYYGTCPDKKQGNKTKGLLLLSLLCFQSSLFNCSLTELKLFGSIV